MKMKFLKFKPYRNENILKAAKGEPCFLNGPKCTGGYDDTVWCHLNESFAGKGIGKKADDSAGFFGCFWCHDWYDGRTGFSRPSDKDILRAVVLSYRRLFDRGIIK